jgi:hypothetical protein
LAPCSKCRKTGLKEKLQKRKHWQSQKQTRKQNLWSRKKSSKKEIVYTTQTRTRIRKKIRTLCPRKRRNLRSSKMKDKMDLVPHSIIRHTTSPARL